MQGNLKKTLRRKLKLGNTRRENREEELDGGDI